MRMMRRAGLLATSKLPTLYELFSAATVVASEGHYDDYDPFYARINLRNDDTSDPVWVISCTGNGIAFAKVKNRAVTYLKTAVTSSDPSSTEFTVMTYGSTGTAIESGYAYGTYLLILRFSDFSEAEIDAALSRMGAEILAGRNSSRASTLSTPASNIIGTQQHLYLQMYATSSSQGLSLVSGAALTTPIISRSGTAAGTLAYWRLSSNNYYLSVNGTNNASVFGGTICHLS